MCVKSIFVENWNIENNCTVVKNEKKKKPRAVERNLFYIITINCFVCKILMNSLLPSLLVNNKKIYIFGICMLTLNKESRCLANQLVL